MSRSEDLIIINAELAALAETDRARLRAFLGVDSDEAAIATVIERRRQMWAIRPGTCDCGLCQVGRKLLAAGLL